MPRFHNKVTNLQELGPTIELIIYPPKPIYDIYKAQGKTVPYKKTIALIDTGASISGIHEAIVVDLGLISRNSIPVGTPNGPALKPTYDVGFLMMPLISLIFPVQVIGANLDQQPYGALIGRDILEKCTLIYNGWDHSYREYPVFS